MVAAAVDLNSPAQTKVARFRSLFRGREDVYARRFESPKSGNSGYTPACANEWVRGVCRKPQIKCADCAHHKFLPLTDEPAWKRDYAGTVRRLAADGVDTSLASLFVHVARPRPPDAGGAERARSATEAFLYRRLQTLPQTRGRFRLDAVLPIAFDGLGRLEVDLPCDDRPDTRIAVELDGDRHLADPAAYRRDRRKDLLLQESGYLVLRFLAQDGGKDLDRVLETILRALARRPAVPQRTQACNTGAEADSRQGELGSRQQPLEVRIEKLTMCSP